MIKKPSLSLSPAHQGYVYQDIVGALFIAREISLGEKDISFTFDVKKSQNGFQDKFDDITIHRKGFDIYIQVKYSTSRNLEKEDFSQKRSSLALFDLFYSWKNLHKNVKDQFRICLAWKLLNDETQLRKVLVRQSDIQPLIPGAICYQFNIDELWPIGEEVLNSWVSLKKHSKYFSREEFKRFLESLVIEVQCPQTSLLKNFGYGIDKLLYNTISKIGIGIYPNDHLSVEDVARKLVIMVTQARASDESVSWPISSITHHLDIQLNSGGIEEKFPVDHTKLVETPERVCQILSTLEEHQRVILTSEPGAGKSWLVESLIKTIPDTKVIKHYCYVSLNDTLSTKRISVNTLYGSLVTQIKEHYPELQQGQGTPTTTYGADLQTLNYLLSKITKKTLLIIDGIDHIWRVYQKNRGSLNENQVKIIEAITRLDYSNKHVSVLLLSQPIQEIETLESKFHKISLEKLPESFVQKALLQEGLEDRLYGKNSLSSIIYQKTEGNALYTRYIIEQLLQEPKETITWVRKLPSYDFNLESYYTYLSENISEESRISTALCGADFPLTEKEVAEITHVGDLYVKQDLATLKPILKYAPSSGYSIYHESFKRFIVEKLHRNGADVSIILYLPLIDWLQSKDFFRFNKAYSHLFKLYWEINQCEKIFNSISIDFVQKSLENGHSIKSITRNHNFQKKSLAYINDFKQSIIIVEQDKVINDLERNLIGDTLLAYLDAIHTHLGENEYVQFMWDGDNLLIELDDALYHLKEKALKKSEIIHWNIIPTEIDLASTSLPTFIYKRFHLKEFQGFDNFIKEYSQKNYSPQSFLQIINITEWWSLRRDNSWLKSTPNYKKLLSKFQKEELGEKEKISSVIDSILGNDKFYYDERWEVSLRKLIRCVSTSTQEELDETFQKLSNHSWFRNWLIYLIKISELSSRSYTQEEVLSAFSYLVRDLEPFKGEVRAMDLYKQTDFIHKSFYRGLHLCKENDNLTQQCLKQLEKLTGLTTELQRSFDGPLTTEKYLEILEDFSTSSVVLSEYENSIPHLSANRIYNDIAQTLFKKSVLLRQDFQHKKTQEEFLLGIQCLTAYGFRKDRTLSEILDCSANYQKAYVSLSLDWFYQLLELALTVTQHTDGKSTTQYPIEWFKEFVQVYPNEAIKFLIRETINNNSAHWYEEDSFLHLLEKHSYLFTPDQWFLLIKTLPLANSEDIIKSALRFTDDISPDLHNHFLNWIKTRPKVFSKSDPYRDSAYSQDTIQKFYEIFDEPLISPNIKSEHTPSIKTFDKKKIKFQKINTKSFENLLKFIQTQPLSDDHLPEIYILYKNQSEKEQKTIIREVVKNCSENFNSKTSSQKICSTFENNLDYVYVCLFVYSKDGWSRSLIEFDYFDQARKINSTSSFEYLKEILGKYICESKFPEYSLSKNLINTLVQASLPHDIVKPLFDTLFSIVKARLPFPPKFKESECNHSALGDFTQNELVVALLIARLKTLTLEKTQSIIWSLTYIAKRDSNTIIRPFKWAFENHHLLLPIHRALLLQILHDFLDKELVPDDLVVKLFQIYPTYYYLEDQYIRYYLNEEVPLPPETPHIQQINHTYDDWFFGYIHPKYHFLQNTIGILHGSYKSYASKRDKIPEKYRSYHIRTQEIPTPIIPLSNASYEVINQDFYLDLKYIDDITPTRYLSTIKFFLDEIILQNGAYQEKPSFFPSFDLLEEFSEKPITDVLQFDNWVLASFSEKNLIGEMFEKKRILQTNITICTEETTEKDYKYTGNLFKYDIYTDHASEFSKDQPISFLEINEIMEQTTLLFISPWLMTELDLKIVDDIHQGLYATDKKGDIIVKTIRWKQDYYGDLSDSTEVPKLDGVALLIRKDYFDRILSIYDHKLKLICTKRSNQ